MAQLLEQAERRMLGRRTPVDERNVACSFFDDPTNSRRTVVTSWLSRVRSAPEGRFAGEPGSCARRRRWRSSWRRTNSGLLARHRAERTAFQSQHSSVLSNIARDFELTVEKALADQRTGRSRPISLESTQGDRSGEGGLGIKAGTVPRHRVPGDRLRAAVVPARVQGSASRNARQEPRELEEQAWQLLRRPSVSPGRGCGLTAAGSFADVECSAGGYSVEIRKRRSCSGNSELSGCRSFSASGALLWHPDASVGSWPSAIGATMDRLGWPWILASGAIAFWRRRHPVRDPTSDSRAANARGVRSVPSRDRECGNVVELPRGKIRAGEADMKKITAQQQCDQQIRRATTVAHQQRLEGNHFAAGKSTARSGGASAGTPDAGHRST